MWITESNHVAHQSAENYFADFKTNMAKKVPDGYTFLLISNIVNCPTIFIKARKYRSIQYARINVACRAKLLYAVRYKLIIIFVS